MPKIISNPKQYISMAGTSTDKRTDACSRPLCYTLKFLAYKKRQKHEKKNYPFSYATFQCGQYNVLKKIFFSCPQKFEKNALKSC